MEIKDIRALVEQNGRLREQVERLSAENASLCAQTESLKKEKAELENTVSSLRSMMEWFRRRLFGKMSEKKLPLDPSALEPTLFDEPLGEEEQASLDAEVKAMEERNARVMEVRAHRREVRKPVYTDLPVIVTDIYPEGMKDNPDYVEIGVENTDRLAVRPAQMYIDRVSRHKFVLRSRLQTEDPDRRAFEIAPLPEMIIPKGMASESLLADILINKYYYHLPFYRQIRKYRELGVVLGDATMIDWFATVCSRLRPLCA